MQGCPFRGWLCAAALAVLLVGGGEARAVPILGGQLFATGGEVRVTVMPATAGFTSELRLYPPAGPPGGRFIATNRQVGQTFNLGIFPEGIELVFGIFVRDTRNTFLMGPGTRNPDGIPHAVVDLQAPGDAIVGFEDLFGGGDRDYDDNVFRFQGGVTSVVPEPSTLTVAVVGLLGLAGYGWRRRRPE